MEMLKKLKKRIVPLVLAVVIFATSVVSGPMSLTARAASVTVDAEFSTELAMLLYNIMETVAISSGIKDGLDDYESGSTLYDAFISFLDSAATPSYLRDTYITLADGSSMTIQDAIETASATVGSNALKLPEEEVFTKYRTISGGKNPENSPTPSPTPSGDDYVVLDKFHEIAFILVSAPMLAMFTKFFEVVLQGNIEGVDPAKYYGTAGLFTGELDQDAEGNYIISGKITSFYDEDYLSYYIFDTKSTVPVLAVYGSSVSDKTWGTLTFYGFQFNGSLLASSRTSCIHEFYKFGVLSNSSKLNNRSYSSGTTKKDLLFNLNIPVFGSSESANSFCKTGDLSGLLNDVPYDYHSMTAAAPDTLENLSGTKLDPAKVPAMNNAMKEAANGVEATGTDKEANNAEMIAAVKAAVAEALAEAQPDPAPEPTAAPDPEPSTAPDPGTDTNYSGILGLILSAINAIASGIWDFFSHPIQNITNGITGILEMFPQVNALIQALPAAVYGFFQDPLGTISTGISNLYNGVLRIIEIFPEQVQLVLGNIASLPAAMLQVFADPLGAIQSLLGALPSWANLQAYLDKILQALLDPVSVLQPSDPGGTDPGGDGSGDGSKFNLSSLFNGLIYLILILILLLKIFIHCLQFIINIFKIEPTQGFLPDDMVTGLNFLKQLQIEGIGLSVYDFMMGLVYILMFFGVVKLLRGYVYKIRIPSGGK